MKKSQSFFHIPFWRFFVTNEKEHNYGTINTNDAAICKNKRAV